MSRIAVADLAAPALHLLRLQASLSGASDDYHPGSPERVTDKPLIPLGGRIADIAGSPHSGYAGTPERVVDHLSHSSRNGDLVKCIASHSLRQSYQALTSI